MFYRECRSQCSKTRILDYCNDSRERENKCGCMTALNEDTQQSACLDSRQALCRCAERRENICR